MFKKLLDFTGTKTFLFITLAVLTFECYDLEREIKKSAPKEAHKHLKSLTRFKHLRGKKIRVRLADEKYRDAYNERLKLYEKDKSEYVKLKERVKEDLWNGMVHGGEHIKISNFMSRGEMFPEWVKVEYKTNLGRTKYKYVRAYNAAKERKYPLPLMEE